MSLLSGQRAFVAQRLSALVLLAFAAAGAARLAFGSPVTLAQWQAWAAQPLAAAAMLMLALAVLVHAWVGIRDVALDYVRPLALRVAVLALAAAGLAFLGLWTGILVVSHAL